MARNPRGRPGAPQPDPLAAHYENLQNCNDKWLTGNLDYDSLESMLGALGQNKKNLLEWKRRNPNQSANVDAYLKQQDRFVQQVEINLYIDVNNDFLSDVLNKFSSCRSVADWQQLKNDLQQQQSNNQQFYRDQKIPDQADSHYHILANTDLAGMMVHVNHHIQASREGKPLESADAFLQKVNLLKKARASIDVSTPIGNELKTALDATIHDAKALVKDQIQNAEGVQVRFLDNVAQRADGIRTNSIKQDASEQNQALLKEVQQFRAQLDKIRQHSLTGKILTQHYSEVLMTERVLQIQQTILMMESIPKPTRQKGQSKKEFSAAVKMWRQRRFMVTKDMANAIQVARNSLERGRSTPQREALKKHLNSLDQDLRRIEKKELLLEFDDEVGPKPPPIRYLPEGLDIDGDLLADMQAAHRHTGMGQVNHYLQQNQAMLGSLLAPNKPLSTEEVKVRVEKLHKQLNNTIFGEPPKGTQLAHGLIGLRKNANSKYRTNSPKDKQLKTACKQYEKVAKKQLAVINKFRTLTQNTNYKKYSNEQLTQEFEKYLEENVENPAEYAVLVQQLGEVRKLNLPVSTPRPTAEAKEKMDKLRGHVVDRDRVAKAQRQRTQGGGGPSRPAMYRGGGGSGGPGGPGGGPGRTGGPSVLSGAGGSGGGPAVPRRPSGLSGPGGSGGRLGVSEEPSVLSSRDDSGGGPGVSGQPSEPSSSNSQSEAAKQSSLGAPVRSGSTSSTNVASEQSPQEGGDGPGGPSVSNVPPAAQSQPQQSQGDANQDSGEYGYIQLPPDSGNDPSNRDDAAANVNSGDVSGVGGEPPNGSFRGKRIIGIQWEIDSNDSVAQQQGREQEGQSNPPDPNGVYSQMPELSSNANGADNTSKSTVMSIVDDDDDDEEEDEEEDEKAQPESYFGLDDDQLTDDDKEMLAAAKAEAQAEEDDRHEEDNVDNDPAFQARLREAHEKMSRQTAAGTDIHDLQELISEMEAENEDDKDEQSKATNSSSMDEVNALLAELGVPALDTNTQNALSNARKVDQAFQEQAEAAKKHQATNDAVGDALAKPLTDKRTAAVKAMRASSAANSNPNSSAPSKPQKPPRVQQLNEAEQNERIAKEKLRLFLRASKMKKLFENKLNDSSVSPVTMLASIGLELSYLHQEKRKYALSKNPGDNKLAAVYDQQIQHLHGLRNSISEQQRTWAREGMTGAEQKKRILQKLGQSPCPFAPDELKATALKVRAAQQAARQGIEQSTPPAAVPVADNGRVQQYPPPPSSQAMNLGGGSGHGGPAAGLRGKDKGKEEEHRQEQDGHDLDGEFGEELTGYRPDNKLK